MAPTTESEPGTAAERIDSVVSNTSANTASSVSEPHSVPNSRKLARRNKRAETREKMGMHSASLISSSTNNADLNSNLGHGHSHGENNEEADSLYDEEDDVNDDTPGSFAVVGPSARRSMLNGTNPHTTHTDNLETENQDTARPLPTSNSMPIGGTTTPALTSSAPSADHDLYSKNKSDNDGSAVKAPIVLEAELVSDSGYEYPFSRNHHGVIMAEATTTANAQKGDEQQGRTVPLKWLIIGGCCLLIVVVAVSVSLGVVLGSRDDTDNSNTQAQAPTSAGPTDIPNGNVPITPMPTAGTAPTVVSPVAPITVSTSAPTAAPTRKSPVVITTPAPMSIPTAAPVNVVAPTAIPNVGPEPTLAPINNAPIDPPTAMPEEENGGGSSPSNPLYVDPEFPGLQCQCNFYAQNIIVTAANDWASLSSGQLQGFIGSLLAGVEIWNPYPNSTRRQRQRNLRQETYKSSVITTMTASRQLIPSELQYGFSITSQTRIGGPSAPPLGLQLVYRFEVCLDDPDFLQEYYTSFVTYMSQSFNLENQATALQNAGISSIQSITGPTEQQNMVCPLA